MRICVFYIAVVVVVVVFGCFSCLFTFVDDQCVCIGMDESVRSSNFGIWRHSRIDLRERMSLNDATKHVQCWWYVEKHTLRPRIVMCMRNNKAAAASGGVGGDYGRTTSLHLQTHKHINNAKLWMCDALHVLARRQINRHQQKE